MGKLPDLTIEDFLQVMLENLQLKKMISQLLKGEENAGSDSKDSVEK